jgi:hypothetical protein
MIIHSHKRILGILYIVVGSLQLVALTGVSFFLTAMMPFVAEEAGPEGSAILNLLGSMIPFLFWALILVFAIPSIIGGIAILNEKSWALTLLLVIGCFKLFSFPFGTALGIYTIWVYAESNKHTPHQP